MTPQPALRAERSGLLLAAFYCGWAAAVAPLVSIAAFSILLSLAVACLLASGTRPRLPPIWGPLAIFMAGTAISLALSGNPAAGWPQIRKFFVYLVLLVVFSTFRRMADVRRLALSWAAVGGIASAVALIQFAQKVREAHQHGQPFYDYYVGERITGFMSHWMTFGGEQMIVLLMLTAFLLFSSHARKRNVWLGLLGLAVLSAALLLGFTRSIWLGTAGAAVYLVCFWKPRLLIACPVLLAGALWLGPAAVRARFLSAFEPGKLDSNQHRIVCWRTGWEMIRAHPWFGLGPEIVKLKFMEYVPPDIPRPLPAGWYGHLHSIYIHYAAERGIPTMLVLMWLLAKILWDFLRAIRRLPPGPGDERFILHGAVAVVVAIMISGIFELNLGDSEVLAMFLAAVACGYVALESAKRREPAVA